ncbi:MAG: hypothetical protein OIN66_14640 [Candidatus Methanoperedens sp.]|nr:hypothetical protein [Candidatus Methanoperedens sp.]
MSFLGTSAGSAADLTLIIQIAGFIILSLGVMHVKRKDFPGHFRMARLTVFWGVVAFLWMGYSFMVNFQGITAHITTMRSMLAISHITIGTLALLAGISFATNRLIKKVRYQMRAVFLLWAAALFLGISLYAVYYVYF